MQKEKKNPPNGVKSKNQFREKILNNGPLVYINLHTKGESKRSLTSVNIYIYI